MYECDDLCLLLLLGFGFVGFIGKLEKMKSVYGQMQSEPGRR